MKATAHAYNEYRKAVLVEVLKDAQVDTRYDFEAWSFAIGFLDIRDIFIVLLNKPRMRKPTPAQFVERYNKIEKEADEWDRKRSGRIKPQTRAQKMASEPIPGEDLFGLKEKDDAQTQTPPPNHVEHARPDGGPQPDHGVERSEVADPVVEASTMSQASEWDTEDDSPRSPF